MTTIARLYIDEMRQGLDETVVPVFAPDTPVEVGTIGSFDGDQFVPTAHIRDRGSTVEVRVGPPTPIWTFDSHGQVEFSPAIQVGLPDGSKVFSAVLSFSGRRGVIASFADVVESTAIDADDFDRVMWELYLAGKLRADRLVVWSVRRATRGTVVVASERGASIELTAPAAATLTLGGLSAGVGFGRSTGVAYTVSHAELTAYVRLKRVTPDGRTPIEDIRRFDAAEQERLRARAIETVRLDDILTH